jgi:hypothetical protein
MSSESIGVRESTLTGEIQCLLHECTNIADVPDCSNPFDSAFIQYIQACSDLISKSLDVCSYIENNKYKEDIMLQMCNAIGINYNNIEDNRLDIETYLTAAQNTQYLSGNTKVANQILNFLNTWLDKSFQFEDIVNHNKSTNPLAITTVIDDRRNKLSQVQARADGLGEGCDIFGETQECEAFDIGKVSADTADDISIQPGTILGMSPSDKVACLNSLSTKFISKKTKVPMLLGKLVAKCFKSQDFFIAHSNHSLVKIFDADQMIFETLFHMCPVAKNSQALSELTLGQFIQIVFIETSQSPQQPESSL